LKTVHFKKTMALGNFCHGHQQYVCVFAALYLPQDGGSELFFSDGGGDTLHALHEGALGQQAEQL
jgi:hypothetical protein